jgi:hypothetical protein
MRSGSTSTSETALVNRAATLSLAHRLGLALRQPAGNAPVARRWCLRAEGFPPPHAVGRKARIDWRFHERPRRSPSELCGGVPLGDLVPVDDVPPRLQVVRALVPVLEVGRSARQARLKIVVSPVRVRVSPSAKALQFSECSRRRRRGRSARALGRRAAPRTRCRGRWRHRDTNATRSRRLG